MLVLCGWACGIRCICIRVVTPDLAFVSALISSDTEDMRRYRATIGGQRGEELTSCDAVNLLFRGYGHIYLYSQAELTRAVQQAGFADIVETRAVRPQEPIFASVEGQGGVLGEDINAMEAFALEARKPLTANAP